MILQVPVWLLWVLGLFGLASLLGLAAVVGAALWIVRGHPRTWWR
jgi:hypothetical protein